MRARLVWKLISVVVLLVLSVMAARTLTSSSTSSSPLNPLQVSRNGIAGVCAEQRAIAQASGRPAGTGAPVTAVSPALLAQLQASNPGGLAALKKAGGSLACPPATTP